MLGDARKNQLESDGSAGPPRFCANPEHGWPVPLLSQVINRIFLRVQRRGHGIDGVRRALAEQGAVRMSGPTDTAPATLDIDADGSLSDLESAANRGSVGAAAFSEQAPAPVRNRPGFATPGL